MLPWLITGFVAASTAPRLLRPAVAGARTHAPILQQQSNTEENQITQLALYALLGLLWVVSLGLLGVGE